MVQAITCFLNYYFTILNIIGYTFIMLCVDYVTKLGQLVEEETSTSVVLVQRSLLVLIR